MENFVNSPEKLQALYDTKLFVLDMDGTIYLGKNPIDGAIDFCERIVKSDRKLMYFTNNASRNPEDYVKKLNLLGVPC